MVASSIVLVVHLCTVLHNVPFLKDCSAKVFPVKSAEVCEQERKSWAADPVFKFYFRDDRKTIKQGDRVQTAEPFCTTDPEKGFVPVDKIPQGQSM